MNAKLIQYSTVASRDKGEFRWLPVGMGYIITDESDNCIVIDGGNPEDAADLVKLIEASNTSHKVDLWILTHPHPDHFGALVTIAEDPEFNQRLSVKQIAMSVPSLESKYAATHQNYSDIYNKLMRISELLACNIITPISGDALKFGKTVVDILFTQADYTDAGDPNELSMIFSITAAGTRILFTGDTYRKPAEICCEKYPDNLKCDICQLAHHALNGGSERLYDLASPKICLIPTARSAYNAMLFGDYKNRNETAANRYIMQKISPSDHIISAEGTRTLTLDNGSVSVI